MRTYDVVIVGAGHGGAQLAASLRQLDFVGRIALIGAEPHFPYERPPLSKEYLAGEKPFERLLIRPPGFWGEHGVDVLLERHVVTVQPDRHSVVTEDGEAIGYRALVWATGGNPIRLTCPGHDLRGVNVIRNRADADRMICDLAQARRVVIVGAGYIGLESAAVLSKLGADVTVLEARNRILARVAGPAVSRFYEAEHRARGVEIRTGSGIAHIIGHAGTVAGVGLTTGSVMEADMVVVGIGIEPAVGPLRAVGAAGSLGVDVDGLCRTSLPDVFAIGDCTAQQSRHTHGVRMRIESVQNATDQAGTVAKYLVGQEVTYDAVPWFWSNQYDLRLQTLGISLGYDEEIVRGDPAARSFSVLYRRAGKVIALDCVNAVRDYVQGRELLRSPRQPSAAMLADAGVALKDLV